MAPTGYSPPQHIVKKENRRLLTGILIGALVSGISVYIYMKSLVEYHREHQKLEIAQQGALIDSLKRNNLGNLMKNLLDKIDEELRHNKKRILTDETVSRIAAFCYLSKPYSYPQGDSLPAKRTSPERGQLLLMILNMNIDSGSMHKIKHLASFAFADLRDVNLVNTDLSGADLKGADLWGANLKNSDLTGVDLSYANLWGADLSHAHMNNAILRRVDLSWANLNDAELKRADLTGGTMVSTQMRRTNLKKAIMQWADLTSTFLNGADISEADLHGTLLRRANLEKANFSNANLTMVNLTETNLTEADFTGSNLSRVVVAEADWINTLDQKFVKGAKAIQSYYRLVDESSESQTNFCLEKRKSD